MLYQLSYAGVAIGPRPPWRESGRKVT